MDPFADHLGTHRFEELFIEALGWDRTASSLEVNVDDRVFAFRAVAHKRGFHVLVCTTDRLVLVNRVLLRHVQRQVARTFHEHILIYTSEKPNRQVWQWAVRLPDGRRLRHREHPFFSASAPAAFLARLRSLRFTLDEEENVSLLEALARVRETLDTTAELDLFVKHPKYALRSDQLIRAVRNGIPGAFDEFVLFHLPLARHMAKKACRWFPIELEDAEQIAVIGLMRATQKYDLERGCQFSTYATWWIRSVLQRYGLDDAHLIYLPPHVYWPCFRQRFEVEKLAARFGPRFNQHVAEEFFWDAGQQRQWSAFERATEVRRLADHRESEICESYFGIESDGNLVEEVERNHLAEIVRDVVNRLHPRFAEIIRLRYGFDGPPLTLEETGKLKGVTRERIRQLQVRAEERLDLLLRQEVAELKALPPKLKKEEPDNLNNEAEQSPRSKSVRPPRHKRRRRRGLSAT